MNAGVSEHGSRGVPGSRFGGVLRTRLTDLIPGRDGKRVRATPAAGQELRPDRKHIGLWIQRACPQRLIADAPPVDWIVQDPETEEAQRRAALLDVINDVVDRHLL
jgi:hypothetical protein